MEKHQCSICGFNDKQDDILQTEQGDWVHHECEQDALEGEHHRRETEAFVPAPTSSEELIDLEWHNLYHKQEND